MIAVKPRPAARLVLEADTAADLMKPNPVSIRYDATVGEAVAFLTDHAISGAPVIDAAGRAVGVVTQTDLLIHDREGRGHVPADEEEFAATRHGRRGMPDGYHLETGDPCQVSDVMTPGVISVTPDTPAARVVAAMRDYRVHRLFVVDGEGVPVGVIGLYDLLARLG